MKLFLHKKILYLSHLPKSQTKRIILLSNNKKGFYDQEWCFIHKHILANGIYDTSKEWPYAINSKQAIKAYTDSNNNNNNNKQIFWHLHIYMVLHYWNFPLVWKFPLMICNFLLLFSHSKNIQMSISITFQWR